MMRAVTNPSEHEFDLDLLTVRERVAAIKRSWTPEEVARRAEEGRRRRRDLTVLVEALERCQSEDCDHPELSLIG
jgi:hypothetical protein